MPMQSRRHAVAWEIACSITRKFGEMRNSCARPGQFDFGPDLTRTVSVISCGRSVTLARSRTVMITLLPWLLEIVER
jgi:hypothetical protein